MPVKKWGILLLLLLGWTVWLFADAYHAAVASKQKDEQRAIERAKEEADLTAVLDVDTYYGNETYVVVIGKNKDNKKMVVWVPEKGNDLEVKPLSSGISKEEALALLKAEYSPKKVISAKLGMEKGIPLWELTYMDKQNRYSFYYVSFEDGTFIKRYSFAQ
jgi:uncharacterized protein YpmB